MRNLLVIFMFLAVFGAISYADLDSDPGTVDLVGEPRSLDRVERSVEVHRDARDGTELVRRKRTTGIIKFVTNVFVGAFEVAKKAAKAFIVFLQAAYKFLSKWIAYLIKAAKSANITFKVAYEVLMRFVKAVGWALKRTFVIAGQAKNFFMNTVLVFLGKLKDNAIHVLTLLKNALSNFYNFVVKIVRSVYDEKKNWEKENARLAALAEKEGGEKISKVDDSYFKPPADVSFEGYDQSKQSDNLKSLGVVASEVAIPEDTLAPFNM